jgi:hypothetical protein
MAGEGHELERCALVCRYRFIAAPRCEAASAIGAVV